MFDDSGARDETSRLAAVKRIRVRFSVGFEHIQQMKFPRNVFTPVDKLLDRFHSTPGGTEYALH